jgi:flagellar biogenesis protein FliO
VSNASLGVALARVVIVLGLLWVVMRVIRRVSGRSRAGGATRSARRTCTIELLNRRAVGRSASVAAVRVGTKMYVLGITDQRIEKLDECDAPEFDLDIELDTGFGGADDDDDDEFETVGRVRDRVDPRARRRSSLLDSLRERTVR